VGQVQVGEPMAIAGQFGLDCLTGPFSHRSQALPSGIRALATAPLARGGRGILMRTSHSLSLLGRILRKGAHVADIDHVSFEKALRCG
jgi:hypothetical protein